MFVYLFYTIIFKTDKYASSFVNILKLCTYPLPLHTIDLIVTPNENLQNEDEPKGNRKTTTPFLKLPKLILKRIFTFSQLTIPLNLPFSQ